MACGKTRWEDVPLLVLVNQNTASAAEIFAAAISHNQRGLILGSHTFGKGSSQAFVTLDDGHALTFTVYSLAAGARGATHPIDDGVTPHVPWAWPRRAAAIHASDDREIVLATQAALATLPPR
jgi:C-terminal processing protease CtpA/Prc